MKDPRTPNATEGMARGIKTSFSFMNRMVATAVPKVEENLFVAIAVWTGRPAKR